MLGQERGAFSEKRAFAKLRHVVSHRQNAIVAAVGETRQRCGSACRQSAMIDISAVPVPRVILKAQLTGDTDGCASL